jgi:putative ABC transport system permease protein
MRDVVAGIDSDLPVASVRTMDERIGESLGPRRFNMLLISLFAVLALTLAAIGIYGVVAFAVSERTHEIGVRLALGARPLDVLAMVVGRAMRLVAAGAVAGIAAAAVLMRVMSNQVFGISTTDAATFAVVSVGLSLVGFCASVVPARRATRVDPVIALRTG